MPEWRELMIIVGGVFFAIYIVYILTSKLIDRYFKKVDTLEAVKDLVIETQLKSLGKIVETHTENMDDIKDAIHESEKQIIEARNDIKENSQSFIRLHTALKEFVRETSTRLQRIETGKIVQVGKDTWMFKNTQGGGGDGDAA